MDHGGFELDETVTHVSTENLKVMCMVATLFDMLVEKFSFIQLVKKFRSVLTISSFDSSGRLTHIVSIAAAACDSIYGIRGGACEPRGPSAST